jgi:hypothetical protein
MNSLVLDTNSSYPNPSPASSNTLPTTTAMELIIASFWAEAYRSRGLGLLVKESLSLQVQKVIHIFIHGVLIKSIPIFKRKLPQIQ